MNDIEQMARFSLLAEVEAMDVEFIWRITRMGRAVEWDLADGTLETFARLIRSQPKVIKLINEIDLAHALVTKNPDVALAKMLKVARKWEGSGKLRGLKEELRAATSAPRRETEELIKAVEDHFGRRMNSALDVSADRAIPGSMVNRKPIEMAADAFIKAARSPEGKAAGAELMKSLQMLRAAKKAGPERDALDKLFRFLKEEEDPAWASLAEAINRGGKNLKTSVQGKLGEHIAMRTPWVAELFLDAYAEAKAVARRMEGGGFRVQLVDMPAHALTSRKGMAEIYDGSVWLLRNVPEPPIAVPVMICQVKSGTVADAIEQIANTDLRREFGATIRLESEPGRFVEFEITPPSKELGFESLETRRVLVSSTPPSDRRIAQNLKPGMTIDYTRLPFKSKELRTLTEFMISSKVRKALRGAK